MRIMLLFSILLWGCADGADGGSPNPDGGDGDQGVLDATRDLGSQDGGGQADQGRVEPDRGIPSACGSEDLDGDGYGNGPECAGPDCDEENAAIHAGAPEACNGQDEDCDGEIDEELYSAVCGIGACRQEVPNCVDGEPGVCEPAAPTEESCNGADDDCDGITDEDAEGQECGVGICRRTAACEGGAVGACEPGSPGEESCNGLDDDCDGQTDEGFNAQNVETLYSTLDDFHDRCDGNWERIGPSCNAAINRFCAAQECGSTGFGPIENYLDISHVTCVSQVDIQVVSFAELAMHHEGCNGQPMRIGDSCNAAIHRYCRSRGAVSGFGPTESRADEVDVACVTEGATLIQGQYSVLTGHHPPCNGQIERIGPNCNAAIKRYCISEGYVSGYGPAEHSGDNLAIICLSR